MVFLRTFLCLSVCVGTCHDLRASKLIYAGTDIEHFKQRKGSHWQRNVVRSSGKAMSKIKLQNTNAHVICKMLLLCCKIGEEAV